MRRQTATDLVWHPQSTVQKLTEVIKDLYSEYLLSCTHIAVLLCASFLNISVCSVEGQAHGKTNDLASLPDSTL